MGSRDVGSYSSQTHGPNYRSSNVAVETVWKELDNGFLTADDGKTAVKTFNHNGKELKITITFSRTCTKDSLNFFNSKNLGFLAEAAVRVGVHEGSVTFESDSQGALVGFSHKGERWNLTSLQEKKASSTDEKEHKDIDELIKVIQNTTNTWNSHFAPSSAERRHKNEKMQQEQANSPRAPTAPLDDEYETDDEAEMFAQNPSTETTDGHVPTSDNEDSKRVKKDKKAEKAEKKKEAKKHKKAEVAQEAAPVDEPKKAKKKKKSKNNPLIADT